MPTEAPRTPPSPQGPPLHFPVPLVCPVCHRALERRDRRFECPPCDRSDCPRSFADENGFPNLVVGGRFEDPTDESCMRYEESSNEHTARSFWVPLFRRLFRSHPGVPRLLAVGCGTGIEVDHLNEVGFACVGIDCGNRTRVWPRRAAHSWLLMANALHLPFEDEAFDAVFCGCVFPHVGVQGDSSIVTEHYQHDRVAMARELTRVLKPGGHVVASSPNRRFPFDIFHGRQPGSYRPRFNPPHDPFLLSVADYRTLFAQAGCRAVATEPIGSYWGFVRSKRSVKGRLLGVPVRVIFWLVSRDAFPFLRASVLAPWIVVVATK